MLFQKSKIKSPRTEVGFHVWCFIGTLVLLVFPMQLQAQQTLNLDFEIPSVEACARPWGWSVSYYTPAVQFMCDTTKVHSGQAGLRMQNTTGRAERFELSFFVEPSQILDTEIEVLGWVYAPEFKGKAGFRLESTGAVGDEFGTLQRATAEIEPGEEWQRYNATINIDSNPHSITITLFYEGTGDVGFDDFKLKVNGEYLKSVPVAPEFEEHQVKTLGEYTTPFQTVEPVTRTRNFEGSFEDLTSFNAAVGDARIIALGEATHGTSEFFKLKHRLLQYAIVELGVRVFILEDNQLLTERVNEYVLHGKGDSRTVMKGLFAVWNTREMLQLIEWLRQYNLDHPNAPVEFVGMDVQNPALAFEHLNEFLASRDGELRGTSEALLKPIKEGWQNSFFTPESTLKEWDSLARINHHLVTGREGKWLQQSKNRGDSVKVAWALKNARTIKQFTETALGGVYEGRDKAMAENVEWILNQRPLGTKAVVWAHDSHVSRGDAPEATDNFFLGSSMGSYLSDTYGDAYRVFGLFTYQGTCLGTISYSNFTQMPFQLYTSPKGSLDEGLHQLSARWNQPLLLTDLRPLRNDSKQHAWMNLKRPVRYVGYVAEDYGFGGRYRIPYQFDGILFVDTSTASVKPD